MKFLVLGSSGMAGHMISIYLLEKGHKVYTFSRMNFPYGENILGDAIDVNFLNDTLLNLEFDVVINAIGILNEDCNKNKAYAVFINSYLPHFIDNVLKNTKKRLIHLSTDCVFSGNKGSYLEGCFKDGNSFYDKSKSLGEVYDGDSLTFRNSIIGPDMKESGIGLFNWFMKQNGLVNGYTQVYWSGVTTLTLAIAIEKASELNLTGLYHLVNNQKITKFELLKLFNKAFKKSEIQVIKNHKIKIDKSLICSRIDFDFIVPSYEQMILEQKDFMDKHKFLYKHYYKDIISNE